MISYYRKNLQNGSQIYQSKTLVLDASTQKASMFRRVDDHYFDFSRIPRGFLLLFKVSLAIVLSPYFSKDSRVSYLDNSPEARLPTTSWIDGESRQSSPFMGPFPYYFAMLKSMSGSKSPTDCTSFSETAKCTRVRFD